MLIPKIRHFPSFFFFLFIICSYRIHNTIMTFYNNNIFRFSQMQAIGVKTERFNTTESMVHSEFWKS